MTKDCQRPRLRARLGFALLIALFPSIVITRAGAQAGQAGQAPQAPPPTGPVTQTPPVQPHITPTPLPARVEVPPPPAGAVPADVPVRPITATDAALVALRHQPSVAVAQQQIAAQQGVVMEARSGLGPQANLSAAYTHTNTFGGSSRAGGGNGSGSQLYDASVNVRQLIYDFNHTLESVREQEAFERSDLANLTRVQSDLVNTVKQDFYAYVQDEELVSVQEANVQDQQQHLAEAQARLNTGLGLPSDVVQAQTAVADAIFNLTLARETASSARITLALAMGIDPRTPLIANDASSEPDIPTDNVQALVDQALRQRPDILSAQQQVQAYTHSVNVARTNNAPSIGLTLGPSTTGTNNFPPPFGTFAVGAQVSWDLFDSGLTAGQTRAARANLEIARANLTSAQLAVTNDVSQSYLGVRTAAQRVTTAGQEVANATESLRLMEGRYRAGLGIFLDVLDAQLALTTARANQVNAQVNLNQSRAALYHALGRPIPTP